MASKDFSRATGPRLRISMGKYDPATRTFKAVKDSTGLVTVSNASEQRRLWRAIEAVIEKGEWRDGSGDSTAAAVPAAAAAVSAA